MGISFGASIPILTASPSILVTLIWIWSPITMPSFTFLDRINILTIFLLSLCLLLVWPPNITLDTPENWGHRESLQRIKQSIPLPSRVDLSIADFVSTFHPYVRSVDRLLRTRLPAKVERILETVRESPICRCPRLTSFSKRSVEESVPWLECSASPGKADRGFVPLPERPH